MLIRKAALAAMLAVSLAACGGSGGGAAAAVDPQLARKIAADMPEAELRKLLGEPRSVQALKVGDEHVSDTWYYGQGDAELMVVVVEGKVHAAYLASQPLVPVPEDDDSDGLEPAENDA